MVKAKSNNLFQNILIMGFGTVIAQSINVLIQPVLSRIFPASELGIYTFIISIGNILIPIASLKIDLLIVSEKDETKAQYITDVCMMSNFAISIATLLLLLVCQIFIPNFVLFQYGNVIYFVPILVLTNGLRFLFISYNNRYKQYRLIASLEIMREASRAFVQTVSGFLSFGSIGLLAGYTLAPLAGYRSQLKKYFEGLRKRPRITLSQVKEILFVKGRRQVLYIMPAQLINSFSASLITMLISVLFSATALGYYSMSVRILDVPIMFISANVSKVCYQRICESISNRVPVTRTIGKLVLGLGFASLAVFGLLYFTAVSLCEFVFGGGYGIAGKYIQCLCMMYTLRLVAASFAGAFTAFGRQRFELILNASLVVAAFTAFLISRCIGLDMESFLLIIGFGYSIIYLATLVGTLVCCVKFDRGLEVS